MERQLDIGGLTGIFALVATAAAFVGQWLKDVVNPQPWPSILLVSLMTATALLTTVAAALAIALISRIIAVTGGFTVGFWPSTAMLLQDYALFLAIWTVIWGIPFAVAIFVGSYLSVLLIRPLAFTIGVVIGILILIGLRRFLSEDVWRVVGHFNPASRIGTFKVMLLLAFLLIPGRMHMQRCYLFDVAVASTSVSIHDPLEIHARISGTIVDHSRLRVALTTMSANQNIIVQRFVTEESGRYLALIDLSKLPPAEYRLRVFMLTDQNNDRFALWQPNTLATRTFVIRVRA